jgi:hypothetical protein
MSFGPLSLANFAQNNVLQFLLIFTKWLIIQTYFPPQACCKKVIHRTWHMSLGSIHVNERLTV